MISTDEIDEIARYALTLEPSKEEVFVDKAWGYVYELSQKSIKDSAAIKDYNPNVYKNYVKGYDLDELRFQKVLHDAISVLEIEKKFRNQKPTKKLMHAYIACLNSYDSSMASFTQQVERADRIVDYDK